MEKNVFTRAYPERIRTAAGNILRAPPGKVFNVADRPLPQPPPYMSWERPFAERSMAGSGGGFTFASPREPLVVINPDVGQRALSSRFEGWSR